VNIPAMMFMARLLAPALLGPLLMVGAVEFHVSPDGSNQNDGSAASPFATIAQARNAIRRLPTEAREAEPITVFLHAGRHRISQELAFGPQDSGTAESPVTYTAYRGETAVIDGGREIAGWEVQPDGRWRTTIPEVRSGRWNFRQLYVNGEARQRARTPNEGFLKVVGCPDGTPRTTGYHAGGRRFEFAGADIRPDWHNLDDVEVVVYHFWTDTHLQISQVNPVARIVTFANPSGKTFTEGFTDEGARYIVDNLREGLDQPGEWYLDRESGVLEYLPMPGETPASVEVIAPLALRLIHLTGLRGTIRHVRFENLTFEYTRFDLPWGNSNDAQGGSSLPGAIRLAEAEDCAFIHCRLRNLGAFAFEIGPGSRNNRFVANEIAHVAGGGFHLTGGTEANSPLLRTRNNVITDNHLHHYGEGYPSAAGILLRHTEGNTVAHNQIHHGYYSAISVGWVWGYQRSVSRDNRIEFNHLHDIGQGLLSDMGAIYTLGVSPGTVIRNNLIHDVDAHQYGAWGIYNDAGSSHILVENNVVHHTESDAYHIHYAKEITVRNNIFALGGLGQIGRGRVEPHRSVFLERNIIYWREGDPLPGKWQDEAYEFYSGGRSRLKTTKTVTSNWNLFFNPNLELKDVRFAGLQWKEWQALGRDLNSRYADPLFVDVAANDFRLRPDSPALDLGFEPIDLSSVGPREVPGPVAQ
jgi:hypothetical protein